MQSGGFDHPSRAWLALALAIRYAADQQAPFLATSRALLNDQDWKSAVVLGLALRLAYSLSGGAGRLLEGTSLEWEEDALVLILTSARVAVKGESVRRGLERLGQALGVATRFEIELVG